MKARLLALYAFFRANAVLALLVAFSCALATWSLVEHRRLVVVQKQLRDAPPVHVTTPDGQHKLGSVIIPQQAGDFWVNNLAVSPFAIKDGSSVTRDTFETTHGVIVAGKGGSDAYAALGPLTGSETTLGALWLLGNATARSAGNYSARSDGTDTYWNTPSGSGVHYFYNASTTLLGRFNSSGFTLDNMASILWNASITSPSLSQAAATSDVAPQNLNINAQGPFASATVNKSAGNLTLAVPASVAGANNNGGILVTTGGNAAIRMGYYGGPDNTYAGIWFRDAGTPTSTNFSFLGNQSFTYLNGPAGSVVTISHGAQAEISTTNATGGTGQGTVTFSAAIAVVTRTITGNLTVDTTTNDYVIICDTSGGGFTVTLPTPTNGRQLKIIDKKNSFGTFSLTVARHAAEKIDNFAGSKSITASGYRGTVTSDGTDWYFEFLLPIPILFARRRRAANDVADQFKEAA